MEIGLREWLIVIGIIVIAGILFDGWRRMRGGKVSRSRKTIEGVMRAPVGLFPAEMAQPADELLLSLAGAADGDLPPIEFVIAGHRQTTLPGGLIQPADLLIPIEIEHRVGGCCHVMGQNLIGIGCRIEGIDQH